MTTTPSTAVRNPKIQSAISWETPFLGPMGAAGTMAGGACGLLGGTVLFNAVAGAEPQFATFAIITAVCGLGAGLVGGLAGWALDSRQPSVHNKRVAPGTTEVIKAVRPRNA